MIVEQVVDFTAIDLVHRNCYCKISLVVLPVIYSSLEQILHCIVLQALHRERLARASLSVSKNRNRTCVEHQIEDRLDAKAVKLFIRLLLAESVVKLERLVVNKLGNAIDFVLAVMNDNFRVRN